MERPWHRVLLARDLQTFRNALSCKTTADCDKVRGSAPNTLGNRERRGGERRVPADRYQLGVQMLKL